MIQKIFFSLAGIGFFMFLVLILFGDKGYYDLKNVRKERDLLIEKNAGVENENIALYRTIKRLKHDPKYIENIARQDLGMVGEDEMIFKFKKKKAEK